MTITAAIISMVTGCAVVQTGPQGRVASDQLLVSLATEDSVRALDMAAAVDGKRIRLTVSDIGTVKQDLSYLTNAMRARILQQGGSSTDKGDYDIELVAMVQTIGSDVDRSSIGLPIPLPALGAVSVTQLTFYSDSKQISRCRPWVYAVSAAGKLIFTHPPEHTAHQVRNPVLLGITLGKFSDVKELNHSKGSVSVTSQGLSR